MKLWLRRPADGSRGQFGSGAKFSLCEDMWNYITVPSFCAWSFWTSLSLTLDDVGVSLSANKSSIVGSSSTLQTNNYKKHTNLQLLYFASWENSHLPVVWLTWMHMRKCFTWASEHERWYSSQSSKRWWTQSPKHKAGNSSRGWTPRRRRHTRLLVVNKVAQLFPSSCKTVVLRWTCFLFIYKQMLQ